MERQVITKSGSETQSLGFEFAKQLKTGDVVLLYGDLGAGKTTFVAGIAEGLGTADRILSPTFVLVRQYEIPHRKSSRPFGLAQGGRARTRNLYHIDLYRIEKETDITGLGLQEIIEEEGSITIIEWADRLKKSNMRGYKIYFKHSGRDKREIIIKKLT